VDPARGDGNLQVSAQAPLFQRIQTQAEHRDPSTYGSGYIPVCTQDATRKLAFPTEPPVRASEQTLALRHAPELNIMDLLRLKEYASPEAIK
jgi:hypothetical protein